MNLLTERSSRFFIWIGIWIIIIAIFFFSYQEDFFETSNPIKSDKVGQLGDIIGGLVGSLWALAGVILFYVALQEQRNDFKTNQKVLNTQVEALNQQIREFELQREELEETRKVFQEQSITLKLQQFENTFFNLIKVQQEIKSEITFDTANQITWYDQSKPLPSIIYADNFFEFAQEDFERFYINDPGLIQPKIHERALGTPWDTLTSPSKSEPQKRIKFKYKQFFDVYHNQLGHYFRHLFNIIKFIEKSENEELTFAKDEFHSERIKEKYLFYAGIIQAQMSSLELFFLFYNGFCFPNMNDMIIKYKLIENLAVEDLVDSEHENLYGPNLLKRRYDMYGDSI